jgi:hypothetical protein
VLPQLSAQRRDAGLEHKKETGLQILINGQDYSAAVADVPSLTIQRSLNKGSTCELSLDCDVVGLALPQRNQYIEVSSADGTVMFTGYLATDPVLEYVGQTSAGPRYRAHAAAMSEELVLDRQPLPPGMQGGLNQGAGTILAAMTSRLDARGIVTSSIVDGPSVGKFAPSVGRTWSENAALLAAAGRMAYRVNSGTLSLSGVGAVTHSLDGASLSPSSLVMRSTRTLANDVTVTGAEEPDAFVLEIFRGDGATTEFDLTRTAFAVKDKSLINEGFVLSGINSQVWQVNDPGSRFAVSSGGLSITGGTGVDGQTTFVAIDPVELGGSLVIEAGAVQLAAGSDGIVCGLYSGDVNLGDCVAGYRVRTSEGALLLVPLVNGSEVGTIFTMTPGHLYTLRIRLHIPEAVRCLATYYSLGSDGVLARGGGRTASPGAVEFELQDSSEAPDTPAAVLYDGLMGAVLSASPATAAFCAVNSTAIVGSAGYFTVTRPSTTWVTSVPAGGVERTRRIGLAAEGAECSVSAGTAADSGKAKFYTAATPAAGELIKVRYRTSRRSVARLADVASQSSEQPMEGDTGIPGVAQWMGSVEHPPARCSADCEAAAQAVLDFSTSRAAAWKATVSGENLQQQAGGDVWPGDLVSLAAPFTSASDAAQAASLVVRTVTVKSGAGAPELLYYTLGLANEWADCLSLTLEDVPAIDALLPAQPAPGVNAVSTDLSGIDVTAITSTGLTVSMNATAPTGGGFEVRRQDADFGNGVAPNISAQGLVVRSPIAAFTLPRAAEREQFFIRMYDGSSPPLYSRVSAAIFTNVPLS